MALEIEYFELPSYWASALINGDDDGLDDTDVAAIESFTAFMVREYGQCWCLDVDDEQSFSRYHDATRFGVLACDVSTFAFDVSKRN